MAPHAIGADSPAIPPQKNVTTSTAATVSTLSRVRPRDDARPTDKSETLSVPANSIKVPTSNASFTELDVKPWLVASLSSMAITRPTGIQRACIPKILEGRDVIGGSRTGSGKTVAFAVPILQKWAEDPVGIFAVVLTPTRWVGRFKCFDHG